MGKASTGAAAAGATAVLSVFALVLAIPLLFSGSGTASAAGCVPAGSPQPGTPDIPDGTVAGYSGEQLENAALIIEAGQSAGLDLHGQSIGVMTAMGESSLKVLDRGDTAGPDSRGLFQQRANGAWGTYADRMDPGTSATNFFTALQDVPGWQDLEPSIAASKVQRNADPYHYEQYWDPAVTVVGALTGSEELGDCLGSGPQLAAEGDDLPWPDAPYCVIGGSCPAGAQSPLGMYHRECTDFALWRLNAMAGVTEAPWKYHNSDLALGNAATWKDAWHRHGWDTGTTPEPGAVAWFEPGTAGTGPLGHVAIVFAVNSDGTVTIEEYNGQLPPDDHRYGTRTIDAATADYLYFPG
ncbi:CHAP domain-containing protein [Crystallibacter degradans]|uniref:CHAP domain-containing protein n=1 Tax=Crystallibacter degradans TaxID=2726743 RepID=UPI001473A653|nr:CHAP domain-containing protein [Arthrobacter sp. SF27]NMR32476.1 CHAP domain-containing protein [Arthrobacter sp. SF27]